MPEPVAPAASLSLQAVVAPASMPAPQRFVLALAALEAILLVAKLATGFPLTLWLVCHVILIGGATCLLWQRRAAIGDVSPYAIALIAAFISGPAGAGLAALALARLAQDKTNPELLSAWYDRIALAGDVDPITGLHNTIAMGRALPTSTASPPVFDTVMTQGSLADRQTALGLIARQFSPSYAPALRHALVSPEPVIRVQAAAVAVKVRAELKQTLAAALSRASAALTLSDAAALAVTLQEMANSGLLEDDDRARAKVAVASLSSIVINALPAIPDLPLEPSAVALIETELLAQGDFASFRALRARAVREVPHV